MSVVFPWSRPSDKRYSLSKSLREPSTTTSVGSLPTPSSMTFYTLAVNSVFVFLIAGGFLFSCGGTDGGVLLNLLFYIIITPVISVTMTKLMFMSENGMIVQDAITRIDRVLQSPALSQPEVPQHPKDSSVTLNHVT